MTKPFSQSCENNKGPILEVLVQHLKAPGTLLEIGSGTGQHAAWLPRFLPHLTWQPSDVPENLPGIQAWCDEAALNNVLPPIALDVAGHWPDARYHSLFTANTFHIMAWPLVQRCIHEGAAHLAGPGQFLVYGPFNYCGQFTSTSNARFNDWLQSRDPRSAIRDQEAVVAEMHGAGLVLAQDHAMPANNRLLVFRK